MLTHFDINNSIWCEYFLSSFVTGQECVWEDCLSYEGVGGSFTSFPLRFGGNDVTKMWVERILPYNAAIQCTKRSEFFWIHSPGWMSDRGTPGGCPPGHNILVSRCTRHIHHDTFIHPCSEDQPPNSFSLLINLCNFSLLRIFLNSFTGLDVRPWNAGWMSARS